MSLFSRKTQANQAVLGFLQHTPGPVTEASLRDLLAKKGVAVHKITLYRQLQQLARAGQVEVTRFADGVARYERVKAHHHHVVCRSCHRVEDVEVGEHLAGEERRVAKQLKFGQVTHALEFYGLCPSCQ